MYLILHKGGSYDEYNRGDSDKKNSSSTTGSNTSFSINRMTADPKQPLPSLNTLQSKSSMLSSPSSSALPPISHSTSTNTNNNTSTNTTTNNSNNSNPQQQQMTHQNLVNEVHLLDDKRRCFEMNVKQNQIHIADQKRLENQLKAQLDPSDAGKRSQFMKEQRDKLVAMKKGKYLFYYYYFICFIISSISYVYYDILL